MKKFFILFSILAGIATHSFALTSGREKTDIFKVEMGPSIPFVGDLEDVATTGFLIGGQWIHRISSDLGLGAELSFTSFGDKSIRGGETNVDMVSLLALSRLDLRSSSSKEPYLLAGFGLTQTEIDFGVNRGFFGLSSSSVDDTSPALLVGGGVDIPFEKVTLGLEARYQHIFFDIGNVNGGGALQLLGQLRW